MCKVSWKWVHWFVRGSSWIQLLSWSATLDNFFSTECSDRGNLLSNPSSLTPTTSVADPTDPTGIRSQYFVVTFSNLPFLACFNRLVTSETRASLLDTTQVPIVSKSAMSLFVVGPTIKEEKSQARIKI